MASKVAPLALLLAPLALGQAYQPGTPGAPWTLQEMNIGFLSLYFLSLSFLSEGEALPVLPLDWPRPEGCKAGIPRLPEVR